MNVTGAASPVVQSITLSKGSLLLNINETRTLAVTFNPTNVVNKRVTWTSSNSSVATVSADGKVKGKATGRTTITANQSETKQHHVRWMLYLQDQTISLAPSISFRETVKGPDYILKEKFYIVQSSNRN